MRKIAQELGVDLDSLAGTGPGGRITEEDVRGKGGSSEGRREPLRGVRRVIAEHMARAHREVPAVTWVEECDFSGLDLKQLVPTVLKACAETLKEFPESAFTEHVAEELVEAGELDGFEYCHYQHEQLGHATQAIRHYSEYRRLQR